MGKVLLEGFKASSHVVRVGLWKDHSVVKIVDWTWSGRQETGAVGLAWRRGSLRYARPLLIPTWPPWCLLRVLKCLDQPPHFPKSLCQLSPGDGRWPLRGMKLMPPPLTQISLKGVHVCCLLFLTAHSLFSPLQSGFHSHDATKILSSMVTGDLLKSRI